MEGALYNRFKVQTAWLVTAAMVSLTLNRVRLRADEQDEGQMGAGRNGSGNNLAR